MKENAKVQELVPVKENTDLAIRVSSMETKDFEQ